MPGAVPMLSGLAAPVAKAAGLGTLGKVLLGLGGSALAGELNKPSGASRASERSLARAAEAQAIDVERATKLKKELETLIKKLEPLTGEEKNKLIQLRPGKTTDFSGVRGTGDIDLLMQLAGLGSPGNLVGAAGALGGQERLASQQQTADTVSDLIQFLLGLRDN